MRKLETAQTTDLNDIASQAVTAASKAVAAASKARIVQWRTSQAAEEQSRQRVLAWLRERNAEEEPPAAADDTNARLDELDSP